MIPCHYCGGTPELRHYKADFDHVVIVKDRDDAIELAAVLLKEEKADVHVDM